MSEQPAEFDSDSVRQRFPFFVSGPGAAGLRYLDNAATTQRPGCMLAALTEFYVELNANVRRGVHSLSQRATDAFETARRDVARAFGVNDPRRVVFTRNATEAINLVAHSFAPEVVGAGDALLVSDHEHHANLLPWQECARRQGAQLVVARLPLDRAPAVEDFDAQLPARLKLVAFTRLSNATGVLLPARELIAWARERGAHTVVDLVQAAAHEPIDFDSMGADFAALSAHKVYGPFGIGVLLAAPGRLERMPPLITGGEMVAEVDAQRFTPAQPPARFEAGTPDPAGAHAFARSLAFLAELDQGAIARHERRLLERAHARLSALPGLQIVGPLEPGAKAGVVAFTLAGIDAYEAAIALDAMGFALRAGDHCARPLHQRMGLGATLRASFALYNRLDEVDELADALASLLA